MGNVDLRHLDDAYETAEAPQYGDLPDGKYQVMVDRAELKQSNYNGHWGLNLEMVVLNGEYEGRYIFKWSSLEDTERMGYLKADLQTLGYTARLSGLEDHLEEILDVKLEVTLKSKPSKNDPSKSYQNCYLNKRLSDTPAPVPQQGKRSGMPGINHPHPEQFADDPFTYITDDDMPF